MTVGLGFAQMCEERIEFAESVEERSLCSPEAKAAWSEAIADIAKFPVYGLKPPPLPPPHL